MSTVGPGSFADLNKGTYQQDGWFEQASGRGSSIAGSFLDLADATAPPEVAAATVSSRMEILAAIASPGQALISNGLGWLISIILSPIIEGVIEPALGDPEQMRATASGWEQVGNWLDQVSTTEPGRAQKTTGAWQGAAGDAFRAKMDDFGKGAKAMGGDVRGLKDTLETFADLMDAFVEFCVSILTDLVTGLIVEWLAALAASYITAGASVVAAGTATTIQVANTASKVSKAVVELEKALQLLRGKIKPIIEGMDKLRNGNFALKAIGRKIDGTGLGILTRANEQGFSTTANRFAKGVIGPQALATNITQHLLSNVMGGTTLAGRAARNAAIDGAIDYGIGAGADYAYDTGKDAVTGGGDASDEDRAAAEKKGFNW